MAQADAAPPAAPAAESAQAESPFKRHFNLIIGGVLLLVSVEDRSYAEAAKVLAGPSGTVMSRLSRGRERLLRIMEASGRPATLRRVK